MDEYKLLVDEKWIAKSDDKAYLMSLVYSRLDENPDKIVIKKKEKGEDTDE